jgi:hypothetical protein
MAAQAQSTKADRKHGRRLSRVPGYDGLLENDSVSRLLRRIIGRESLVDVDRMAGLRRLGNGYMRFDLVAMLHINQST